MRKTTARSMIIGLALAVTAATAAQATAGDADEGPAPAAVANHSPNMSHVKNLHVTPKGTSSGGTDIEFTRLNVTGLPGAPDGVSGVRKFAVAGSLSKGMRIVDITRPRHAKLASVYDCKITQGDVQIFTRNGRRYATYTSDYDAITDSRCYREARNKGYWRAGQTPLGTFIADITNPYRPRTVSFVRIGTGSHNMTVHPSGKWMYNSNSDISAPGVLEVVDIRNLRQPRIVKQLDLLAGSNPHDITFNPSGKRAYAAAITHTVVLGTKNPANPRIISDIVDPAINIHHQSDPITLVDPTTGQRHRFLVITDELAGAAWQGCPGGGLHVYDITGAREQTPLKVGFWDIPQVGDPVRCTSHVLRMHPRSKLMTIAWYGAGVRVVDISGLIGLSAGVTPDTGNAGVAGMREVGYFQFGNADTWSAKTNRVAKNGSFFLYGNDMVRGIDVYRYDGTAAQAADSGRWLTPEQAESLALERNVLGPVINRHLDGHDHTH